MKRRILLLIMLMIFCLSSIVFVSIAFAKQYLAADPIAAVTVAESEVDVDGSIVPGIAVVSTDGLSILLLDVDGLGSGPHTFKARWREAGGMWSPWSSPFDASKPGAPGLRIVEQ